MDRQARRTAESYMTKKHVGLKTARAIGLAASRKLIVGQPRSAFCGALPTITQNEG